MKLQQVGRIERFPGEELRSTLFELILWKIFGRGAALWIGSRTEAGHEIPQDVLVTAHSMWKGAVNLAAKYGVDTAAAEEALAAATHATADQLASSGEGTEREEIRDVRNYLFATYMYRIFDIAGKQGSSQTDYVDMENWVSNRKLTDKGTFLDGLESGIYCRELLDAMPPRAKSVAIARYVLGYSWAETAGALDSSVNAAQKALSNGVRISHRHLCAKGAQGAASEAGRHRDRQEEKQEGLFLTEMTKCPGRRKVARASF